MRIRVKVNASAKREGVRLLEEGFYQVRTRAPAEAGRANRRVLELLAIELDVPISALRIVTGHGRPLKLIDVDPGAAGRRRARPKRGADPLSRVAGTPPRKPRSGS